MDTQERMKMNNDKPTCSFKDLILDGDVVRCEVCNKIFEAKSPKELEFIEEPANLEF